MFLVHAILVTTLTAAPQTLNSASFLSSAVMIFTKHLLKPARFASQRKQRAPYLAPLVGLLLLCASLYALLFVPLTNLLTPTTNNTRTPATALARDTGSSEQKQLRSLEDLFAPTSKPLKYASGSLLTIDGGVFVRNVQRYRAKSDGSLNNLVGELLKYADAEMENNAIYSVTAKSGTPSSGTKHDYMSVAPYWWPNPKTKSHLPPVYKDGLRLPQSVLDSKESDEYDRSRAGNFFRNVTILTLAGAFSGDQKYISKAARLMRIWFLEDATAMNPNLKFAQTVHSEKGFGKPTGILDFVHLPMVLDMFRILYVSGEVNDVEMESMQEWLKEYLRFLMTSPQGRTEVKMKNNHGTLYDYHILGVMAFLKDAKNMEAVFSRARGRMIQQFANDGSLPAEMKRAIQLHYLMYGLQAWVMLCNMCERVGEDLWLFARGDDGGMPEMKKGMRFAVPYFNKPGWTHEEGKTEDMERMLYLYYNGRRKFDDLEVYKDEAQLGKYVLPIPNSVFDAKPVLVDTTMVPPFWNLGFEPQ